MNYKFIYILLLSITFNSCAQKKTKSDINMTVQQAHRMMEDLYKEVEYRDQKIFYDLKVFNGACNYKIWVNDMPVYNMYKNAKGELSFGINTEILKSGRQKLKIRLYPFRDRKNRIWEDYLDKYAGLDIEIREMEWNANDRKFDYYPIFTYQTPREGEESLQDNPREFLFEEGKENLPYYEETVEFEVKVPYQLTGWSKSVNLQQENQEELFIEVEAYYKELIQNFENKNIAAISRKYYTKEKEIVQSLFLEEKKVRTRWHDDFLARVMHETAKVKELKAHSIEFFGDGKVVSLTKKPWDSEALVIQRKNEMGKIKYAKLAIYLHRPKPGAPLEIIR